MKKLIAVLGVMGLSFSAIFVRWSTAPAGVLAMYRMGLSALLLTPMLLGQHRGELKAITRRELLLCLASGALLAVHFTTYFASIQLTSIAASTVLVNTEVFYVALLGLLLLGQRVRPAGWLGIALTFAGSCVIAFSDAGGGSNVLLGDGLALLGAMAAAGYTLLGSVCRRTLSTTVYVFLAYSAACLCLLGFLLCQGTPLTGYGVVNGLTALGMAVFCTLLGHSVLAWTLKYLPASFVSAVKPLEPVYASLMGIVILGELPGPQTLLGGLVVVGGVLLCSLSMGQPAPGKAAPVIAKGSAAKG